MKFEAWQEHWLEVYKRPRVKQHTYIIYRDMLRLHITPAFGEWELSDIGVDGVQQFLAQKLSEEGGGMSASSVNLLRAILNASLEDAEVLGLIAQNPCRRIKRFSGSEKRVLAFDLDDQRRIEEHCLSSDDPRCIGILLALYTGIRIGELLALRWCDVDMHERVIRIERTKYYACSNDGVWQEFVDEPKTKSSVREIPIGDFIYRELRKSRRNNRTEFVVIDKKSKSPTVRDYQRFFEKMQTKLVKKPLNFHSLRHTFATRAVEAGVDIKTLSELLGHSDATLTLNRYSHSMLATKKKAMNLVALRLGSSHNA